MLRDEAISRKSQQVIPRTFLRFYATFVGDIPRGTSLQGVEYESWRTPTLVSESLLI